jgi:hypothetical protein
VNYGMRGFEACSPQGCAMGFNPHSPCPWVEAPSAADVLGLPVSGTMAANNSGLQLGTVRNLLMAFRMAIILSARALVLEVPSVANQGWRHRR